MTKTEADRLKHAIERGYNDRKDYPPFALTPWDDRNRYRDYVFKIIDEASRGAAMKYTIVGWYSQDGSNPHITPFARVVEVEADNPRQAYDKGGDALDSLYRKEGASVDFLNWFIKEQ